MHEHNKNKDDIFDEIFDFITPNHTKNCSDTKEWRVHQPRSFILGDR